MRAIKTIFNWYRGLFRHYDNYGMTGAYRIVRKTNSNEWVTAGWKAQVIGNTYVQICLMGILYMGYRWGKERAEQNTETLRLHSYNQGYDDGKDVGMSIGRTEPQPFVRTDSVYGDLHP